MVFLKIYNPIVLKLNNYFVHLPSYLILCQNEKNFEKTATGENVKGIST